MKILQLPNLIFETKLLLYELIFTYILLYFCHFVMLSDTIGLHTVIPDDLLHLVNLRVVLQYHHLSLLLKLILKSINRLLILQFLI